MNNVMHMLGASGDAETHWDPTDPRTVEKARKAFKAHMKARCLAFSVPEPGEEATQIRDFDPAAREIIVTRPLRGG